MASTPVKHKADPLKPYKAYIAVVLAVLTQLGQSGLPLPEWAKLLISAVITLAGTYLTPNPTKKSAATSNGVETSSDAHLF